MAPEPQAGTLYSTIYKRQIVCSTNRNFVLSLPGGVFDHGVLAAISGGADSVAMLYLLIHELQASALPARGKLAVAHVNHGLRASDSDGDAQFVQALAAEYRLPYFECRLQVQTDSPPTLSENTARNFRYDFLRQQAERIGFRYLATAHTADDQTETVLHRIFRGTGLTGLAGIAPQRVLSPAVTLIRPLLHVRRKEIITYLESLGKGFREDKTNFENTFTRNRIRLQILPVLRTDFNPQIDEAVCRLATLAAENQTVLSELFEEMSDLAVIERQPGRIVFNVIPLQRYSLPVLRELAIQVWKSQQFPLREMDYAHWSKLAELFHVPGTAASPPLAFPGNISAWRMQNNLVIANDETRLRQNQ